MDGLTSRIPFSNAGPEINFDKQWAFEIAYFTQRVGTDQGAGATVKET